VTIVEQVHSAGSLDPATTGYTCDGITLTWEDRRHGHGRRRTAGGVEFAISLPGGTVLKAGDCLVLDAERIIVIVEEAAEPVYVIAPRSSREWALYAWHVGNRHQPVMIGETELIFPRNPGVRSLLEQLHAPFREDTRPFNAVIATAGHSH
jgi:urease accessory protein